MSKDPLQTKSSAKPANAPYAPLALDLAKYRKLLDGHDLTDAQKDEYIRALWDLVVSFVDLNMPELFEPTDAQESCGQVTIDAAAVPDGRRAVVYSKSSQPVQDFDEAANLATSPKAEREAS